MRNEEILGLLCVAMEDFVPINPSFVGVVPDETRHHSYFAPCWTCHIDIIRTGNKQIFYHSVPACIVSYCPMQDIDEDREIHFTCHQPFGARDDWSSLGSDP
jgi:hypothetical protein